jgi:curved DNA-binding protein CbpA
MPRDMDHYGLLGVARDASEAEIRERFRTLARAAHPDRAPAANKADAEAKFQDLTEAVNVLTSPERRRAYDFDLAAAAGMSEDADPVAQLAVGRNPKDVKAQHYLGLASARAGDVRAAVKAIESALLLEPHNGALLKDAGAIFRQAGLLLKAEKAYQEAIRWDPAGGEARRALEEIRVQRAGRG